MKSNHLYSGEIDEINLKFGHWEQIKRLNSRQMFGL
jgi:hypothetical protein